MQIGYLRVKLSSNSFFVHHETDMCAICHLTKVSTMIGENMYGNINVVSGLQTCRLWIELSRAQWIKSKERRKEIKRKHQRC